MGAGAAVTTTVGAGAVRVTVTTGRGSTGGATTAGAGGAEVSVDVDGVDIGATLAAGSGLDVVSTAIPTTTPKPTTASAAANPLTSQPDVGDAVPPELVGTMTVGSEGRTKRSVVCVLIGNS
jgi:hypothetical protein